MCGRVIPAAMIAALLALASVAPARAHATLVSSDPPDGAIMPAPPAQLMLGFNEPVSPLVAPTMVSGSLRRPRNSSNSRPSSCKATSLKASVGPWNSSNSHCC